MAGRVGILGAEGRSECIDVAECHRVGLTIELAAYGQVGGLTEEILCIIDGAVFLTRCILDIQGGHLEHLAGAFAVTARDDGGVNVNEVTLLEELVDRIGDQRTNAEYRLEGVGTGTQMRDRTQILHGVTLLLQRIIRGGRTFHENIAGLKFEGLLRIRCLHQFTLYDHCAAHVQLRNFIEIRQAVRQNDLQRLEKRTVIDHHEGEVLRNTQVADPAYDRDLFIYILFGVAK